MSGAIYLPSGKIMVMGKIMFYVGCVAVGLQLLFLWGCAEMPGGAGTGDQARMTSVSFNITVRNGDTVWPSGGVGISDVNIYVYRDGKLEGSVFSGKTDKIGMQLESGREYRFYALSNVGLMYPPAEERLLKSSRYDIAGLPVLQSDDLPMSASSSAVVAGTHCSVSLSLVPVAAKLGLKVEAAERSGFNLKSIRIVNLAAEYSPFSDAYKARTMLPEDFSASQEEISAVSAGKIIYVPVLENCQGELFPGNTDSRNKTPDRLSSEYSSMCTWLEITAVCIGSGDGSGESVYRFCIGGDAVSDCNIVRNTYSRITLRLTGDSMTDYEWNVRNGVKAPEIGFIAAGESGTVSYSDRQGELIGIKVGDCTWRDMVYAGGRYVMVGDEGSLACSSDGESWQVADAGDADWMGIAYGDGKYVAVGYRMTPLRGKAYPKQVTGYSAVSEDGVSWKVSEMKRYCMEDVAYGKGSFVATGYYMTAGGGVKAGRFMKSSDGETWKTYLGFASDFPCLIYGKDRFVAIDDGDVVYSSDGIYWTDKENIGYRLVYNLAYGAGTYAGPDIYGNVVYSAGGLDWIKTETGEDGFSGIFYSNGFFLMPGKAGLLMFSDNGKTWKKAATDSSSDLYCAAVKVTEPL